MYSKKPLNLLNQTTRRFAGVFMGIVFSLATFTQLSAQFSVSVAKADPTCAGFTNGTATATPTGGVAPYTYRWSNGNTGNAISGLGAGIFGVTVTGANNATAVGSVTLTAATALNATFSFANICSGGAVTATATGGTAPYTFNWGGGRVGATQSGLSGGYNVVVTDSKGCSVFKFVNVPAPFTAGLRVGELLCFGDCDAAIDALGQGGTAPYTYRWNTGATTGSIIGIPSGTYSVTITDANGCTSSSTGTVANPPSVTLTTTSVSPTCATGASNGSATVTAVGGRPPFTYRWSNGQTGATATSLGVGTFFVTTTDAKGCNKTAQVIMTSNAGFTVNATSTNATCGGSNGSAAVATTGGTAPFLYKWSTNATTRTLSNLSAGTYSCTVSDASGCSVVASTTVNAAGSLAIALTSTNAACGISNGSATATPTSGTAPFRYLWSNGATTQTIGVLAAGTYSVTVTDASGCTAIGSRVITQSNSFDVTLDARANGAFNISCNGGSDGQVSAMVMGGSAPYTYRWSNGASTAVIANLTAGTYNVTVTDASGCTAVKAVAVTQPTALTASIAGVTAGCSANGSATVTAAGGTPAYTYSWSNGASTASVSSLVAGAYTVSVTDSKGCRATASTTITSSSAIVVATTSTAARCNGGTGSASASATGGSAPYTYVWSNGATTASITAAAGSYLVTVTDAAGCKSSQVVSITQAAAIAMFLDVTDAVCATGSGKIAVRVSGGTAPYTYLWSTGAVTLSLDNVASGTYTLTVTDASGCTKTASTTVNFIAPPTVTLTPSNVGCSGASTGTISAAVTGGTAPYSYAWSNSATSASITGVGVGAYTVTVTDSKGCTSVRSVTLTQASAIVITQTVVSATCLPVGGASVVATGGSGVYTYLWSNGATTAAITNVAGGSYSVTVTDANGCKSSAAVNIPSVVSSNLSSTIALTKFISFNGGTGEATVTAVNGRAPYTYRWSNGSTLATAVGLKAGTYTVTVTDANGCTTTSSITITEPSCNRMIFAGTITGDQNFCNTSELTGIFEVSAATGGAGAVEYLWMWSDFTADFNAGSWNTIAGASGKDLPANLLPNMVRKTNFIRCVRRAGCDEYIEGNVVMKVPAVAFSFTSERFPCLNRVNTFVAADNGAGATYQWSFQGANIASANTRSVNVTFTSVGVKTVTLTISKNGCTQTRNVPVEVVNCFADYGVIFAFSASTNNSNSVRLNWATNDEKKASKYMIEKSADNVNFSLIGTVASQDLPNNLYSFIDPQPKLGRAFYRIHQMTLQNVDVNMSKTEKVTVAARGQALVTYPNPASANLFVEVVDTDNTEGVIEIYSETGALVKVQKFTANQVRYEVDTNSLGKGSYIVKVRKADGTITTSKFSKF